MFIRRCTYIRGRYDASADFVRLQNFIDGIQEKCGDGNSYFYRIALNFFWILDMFFLLYLLLFVIFFFKYFSAPVNRLYYLALPPSIFQEVTTRIKKNCMDRGFVLL